jgi:hypothetical protein
MNIFIIRERYSLAYSVFQALCATNNSNDANRFQKAVTPNPHSAFSSPVHITPIMPILDKIKEVFSSDKSSSSTAPANGKETLAPKDHSTSTVQPGTEGAKPSAGPAVPDLASDNGAAFDEAKVKVIFVLGGPGAGKLYTGNSVW